MFLDSLSIFDMVLLCNNCLNFWPIINYATSEIIKYMSVYCLSVQSRMSQVLSKTQYLDSLFTNNPKYPFQVSPFIRSIMYVSKNISVLLLINTLYTVSYSYHSTTDPLTFTYTFLTLLPQFLNMSHFILIHIFLE